MYREIDARDAAEAPPAELAYAAADASRGKKGLATLQFLMLPATAGIVLGLVASPEAALAGLVLGAAASVYWWKTSKNVGGAHFRVEGRDLFLTLRGDKPWRVPLREIVDVELDIKTIQRVQDGSALVPSTMAIDSKVGDETDTGRIVLVTSKRRVPLTEDYVAHMDAVEWMGKVRVFLRKHGWVPDAEVEDAAEEEDDDD